MRHLELLFGQQHPSVPASKYIQPTRPRTVYKTSAPWISTEDLGARAGSAAVLVPSQRPSCSVLVVPEP